LHGEEVRVETTYRSEFGFGSCGGGSDGRGSLERGVTPPPSPQVRTVQDGTGGTIAGRVAFENEVVVV